MADAENHRIRLALFLRLWHKAPMTCPNCKKPPHAKYKPFCSKRCADVDLGKWLNGSYAVASVPEDSAEEAELETALRAETRH